MIKPYRIWAIILRHLHMQFRDTMRIFDVTFWPMLDITLWGFAGFSFQQEALEHSLLLIPLLGAFFWQIAIRSSVDLSQGFLEELWSKNLVNLFSSPLLLIEWVIGLMLLGCIRLVLVFILGFTVSWFLFGVNIFLFKSLLIPIIFLLLLSGWILGLVATIIIFRWGQRVQNFVWAIGWSVTAFCGVFYSTNILPGWMRTFGEILPMTYTFKGIHYFLLNGALHSHYFIVSLLLNIVYLAIAIFLLNATVRKAKNRGLAGLEVD